MNSILIVEDQADVQRLLGVALRAEDRSIQHCLDADQAWRLLQQECPDVILLDIMMPGDMDGLDLLRKLREDSRYAGVRVIVISARTQQSDRLAAIRAGADAFIAKPFRLEELKTWLNRFLQAGVPV